MTSILNGTTWVPAGLVLILWLMVCIALAAQAFHWRKYTTDNTCLECGYNLASNRSGRCPECGTQFDENSSYATHVSSKAYPELLLFETAEQRRQAWNQTVSRCFRLPWFIAACFVGPVIYAILFLDRAHAVVPYIEQWRWPAVLGLLYLLALERWVRDRKYHRLLRQKLNELGIPVCMKCGTDLREATGDTCPKCRSRIEAAGNLRRTPDRQAPTLQPKSSASGPP